MSISFSGIASGLDTSSWIESLVALRRAKITSLQTQREELVTTQDTLNNIRSFFNTFKTTVQKITDSKFGNTSLFGRNIATSSNLGVLSATANSLAQAASYQIKVDQLATKTTATSGFKETITEESVATNSTFIRDLGGGINITDGMYIAVENSYGVFKSIGITNSTTIGSLLNNMRDFGLNASIDNDGVITVSNGAVIGGTQEILNALGFTSNVTNTTAQTDKITYEVTANADWGTKLEEIINALGTQDKVASGYNLYFNGESVFVTDQSTLNEIATQISMMGGAVEFDANGQLIVRGGSLTGTVAEALDFTASSSSEQVYNSVTSNDPITYQGSVLVQGSTLIGDLDGVTRTFLTVYSSSGGSIANITYDSSDSIDSVFAQLEDYGINASIVDGSVSISTDGSGRYVGVGLGNLFDALGITVATNLHGISNTSSAEITYTKTVAADGTTKLSELGLSGNQTIKINKSYVSGTSVSNTTFATLSFGTEATLNEVFDRFSSYGIKATIEDGVISIDDQLGATIYTANTSTGLLKTLGMVGTTTVTTVGIAATSTDTVEAKFDVTLDTRLGDIYCLGSASEFGNSLTIAYDPVVLSPNDTPGYTIEIDVTEDMTVNDLFKSIERQAVIQGTTVTCSLTDNKIKIDIDAQYQNYITLSGGLVDYLGLTINSSATHDIESGILRGLDAIDGTTLLNQWVPYAALQIQVFNNGYQTITIQATDTVTQMLEKFEEIGFTTSISDGKITIEGGENLYITNDSTNDTFKYYFKLGDTSQAQVKATMSPSQELSIEKTFTMDESTTLADLGVTGSLTLNITKDGEAETLTFASGLSVGDMLSQIEAKGFEASVTNGKLTITGNDSVWVNSSGNNAFNLIFNMNGSNYTSGDTHNVAPDDLQYYQGTVTANASTSLGDLGLTGDATITVVQPNNGNAEVTITLRPTDDLNSVVQKLNSAGVVASFDTDTGILTFTNSDSGYIKSIDSILQDIFNIEYDEDSIYTESDITENISAPLVTNYSTNVTSDTKLADLGVTAGDIILNINGEEKTINISVGNDETIQDFFDLLGENGITARIEDGRIILSADADISFGTPAVGASNILEKLGLNNLVWTDTSEQTSKELKVISTKIEYTSAANFANGNTTLKTLGITAGELVLQKGGTQVKIDIDPDKTFNELNKDGIEFTFDNGHLKISAADGEEVYLVSSASATNFASITGLNHSDDGSIIGSKKLYRVNENSLIVESGIFRGGNVDTGSFMIGNQQITIDADTTIKDVINQINSSDQSNATARWDANNARLVLESRSTGSGYINIGSAGSGGSNFTDILGFTRDNNLAIENQEKGKLAEYYIGDDFKTAQTNVLDSTLTGIEGVTINLKGLSLNGEYTTLTIEKDKETVANAVSDMIDSYNEVIEEIDKEIAKGSDSSLASTLKLLKSQIRSFMTGVHANDGNYNKMYDIGISTKAANAGDINTSGISKLSFDKEKFMQAYSADSESVEKFLVGTDANKGVLWQLEDVLNTAVGSTTGYFSSTNNSYNKQISRLDERIRKAEKDISVYRQRLENKFNAMELLITKMQDQYSSFLNAGFMM